MRDYHAGGAGAGGDRWRSRGSARFATATCSSSTASPSCSATTAAVNPLDFSVAPRGYRVLSHIPRLPDAVIRRVVDDLGTLDAVVRASQRDLEAVEGVGAVRAREIREGLRRLQEHNLVDRYLAALSRAPALSRARAWHNAPKSGFSRPFLLDHGVLGPAPTTRRLFWRKRASNEGEGRLVQGRRQGGVSAPRCRDGRQEGVARGARVRSANT